MNSILPLSHQRCRRSNKLHQNNASDRLTENSAIFPGYLTGYHGCGGNKQSRNSQIRNSGNNFIKVFLKEVLTMAWRDVHSNVWSADMNCVDSAYA